jgi:hypothetical protein
MKKDKKRTNKILLSGKPLSQVSLSGLLLGVMDVQVGTLSAQLWQAKF